MDSYRHMDLRCLLRPLAKLAGATILTALLLVGGAHAQHTAETDSVHTRPLKILMVALGQDMSRINDGLWHEDYEMIRTGAQAIADHPRVPPEQMAAIREALGPRFPQFVGFDQQVHGTAVEIVGSAEKRSMVDVIDAYGRIQHGCTSCHTAFRDEVRMKLYGQADPSK